jgi:hypothetical protein
MNYLDDIDWELYSGFNSKGGLIKVRLGELVAGELPYEEQVELFVELTRDGAASTAGYAAIPILLTPVIQNPRTSWQMAHTACLVIGAIGKEGSAPVPLKLSGHASADIRKLAIKTILQTGAGAELGAAELLDSLSAALAVMGRTDLAETIGELALKEYGVGLSRVAE